MIVQSKAVSDYHYNYRANKPTEETLKLAPIASEKYDEARVEVAKLINAEPHEIAFTNGTTASLNMIADWTTRVLQLFNRSRTSMVIFYLMQQGRIKSNEQLIIVPVMMKVMWM